MMRSHPQARRESSAQQRGKERQGNRARKEGVEKDN